MADSDKKDLIGAIVAEFDRLKGRMERLRLANAGGSSSRIDKAAYVILRSLEATGPERLSVVALHFGLDVSTISRHVAALVGEGLIERVADPDDGRAQLLQITEAGHVRSTEVQAEKCAVVGEQLADWSDEDCSQFVELLGRYNAAMEQRFGAPIVAVSKTLKTGGDN